MTAESVLNSSLCVSIIVYNVPVVVTGIHMGNVGLYDFAIHWFDIQTAFWQGQDPQRVCAIATPFPGQTMKPPMVAQVTIDYGDSQATMSFNGHVTHGQKDETTLCGTAGTLRSTGPSLSDQKVTLHTKAGEARPHLQGTWFENGFQGAMCELLCAIEENREPENGARENLRSLALCFAAVQSANEGGTWKRPGEVVQLD